MTKKLIKPAMLINYGISAEMGGGEKEKGGFGTRNEGGRFSYNTLITSLSTPS